MFPIRLLAVAAVALAALAASAAEPAARPVMTLSSETWDFGTLQQGQTASTTIEVRNEGQAELEIKYVRSSCAACVGNIAGNRLVPPGQAGKVVISFYSKDLSGRQDKIVYIHGSDPDHPYRTVRITGSVVANTGPQIRVESETIDAGLVTPGSAPSYTLNVANRGKAPLVIKQVDASQAVKIVHAPDGPIAPGAEQALELALDTSKLKGLIQEYVALQTNDPVTPVKTVLVVGYVAAGGAGAAPANAVIIRPLGDPVKIPGTKSSMVRAYEVLNLLSYTVQLALPDGPAEQPGKLHELKPGERYEVKIALDSSGQPQAKCVSVFLPAALPDK